MVTRSSLYFGLVILITSGSPIAAADIPWQAYHKTSQILGLFKSASAHTTNLARYQDIPDPDHNSELSLPLITVTDFKTGETGKEVILLIAGEHARELITSEIVYWLYQVLTGKDAELLSWPAAASFASQRKQMGLGAGNLQDWVQDLLKKVVFKIVPIENIEGRKAAEEGDTCLRRTFSGVDLNRNWGTEWKQQALDDEDYGGPHPFSEPESRIVKLIAESSPIRSFVNIHSGEYALYVPWDSHPDLGSSLMADTHVVLEQLNVWCQCMHGAGGIVAGYLAYGTSMDYMYERLHVPYPLTIEVYGPKGLGKLSTGGHPRHLAQAQQGRLESQPQNGGKAAEGQAQAVPIRKADCFATFNPPTVQEYQEVVISWVATLLTLADHLAAHPTASHAAMDAEQHQQPLPKGVTHKMDLAKRIGSDEEQQLLRTAKDDLNISSSGRGEHSTDAATMMLDTLQHHPREEPRELLEASPTQSSYVYPFVLIVGCVMVLAWRKSALPRFSWNRRRLYPSRYEV
ncbi:hypothetical protein WJX79_008797 [Trebouxia sp. C0005]